MSPDKQLVGHRSTERHQKGVALQTLLRKSKRYDPKKAKADRYYQKAKLLRSYHQMLKRESTTSPDGTNSKELKTNGKIELNIGDKNDHDQPGQSSDDEHPPIEGSEDESNDDDGEICKFYNKGKGCRAGASCKFKHQGEPARKISLCKFYTSRTGCQKGSKCKFRHEGTPQIVPQERISKQSILMKIWEQKRAEDEAAKIAKEKELECKQADARRRKQERALTCKNLLKKTATGQPLMKGLMTNLLGKIMKKARDTN